MAYPPAYMGYVGFVRFRPAGDPFLVRATSSDINLKQEVSKPNVIDSRYDRTVYQLGPQEVGGTVAFPAVYDIQGGASVVRKMYELAVTRNNDGSLDPMEIDVRFAPANTFPNLSDFTFTGCIVDTWQFSVSQSEVVNISLGIIGIERIESGSQSENYTLSTFPAFNFNDDSSGNNPLRTWEENTRVITWNDARVEIVPGRDAVEAAGDTSIIGGEFIRTCEVNINNNSQRFYTLNWQLFPQAVAPTKRDVSGNLTIMGRHEVLSTIARTNQFSENERSIVRFGFVPLVSQSNSGAFGVELPNCVFEIEEMSLTNELFETTVNWSSLPAAGTTTNFVDPLANTDFNDWGKPYTFEGY